jgi:anti-sigma regulatory factor (Ser/Thr protein kinase)/CBS domain-containing protein
MRKDDKTVSKIQELCYEIKVEQAMTKDVHTIKQEQTMKDLRAKLRDKKISGVPVCENESLMGIISVEDLINCLIKGEMNSKIGDKMMKEVEVLYSDEPLIYSLNKFNQKGLGRFPVLDRDTQKLVGILTKGDIVKCLLQKLEMNYHEEEIRRCEPKHIFEDIISDHSTMVLRFHIDGGNFKKAGEQSSRLKMDLLKLGYPPEITRRIAIAAYEAEMNTVIFTPGGNLIAELEPDKITVHVVDRGPGIPDIELVMQPGYSTAPDWVRELGFGAGMGLPNIKNCSDEMKLESTFGEGTNLQFRVYLKK